MLLYSEWNLLKRRNPGQRINRLCFIQKPRFDTDGVALYKSAYQNAVGPRQRCQNLHERKSVRADESSQAVRRTTRAPESPTSDKVWTLGIKGEREMKFDLVIRNGVVVDGSGRPRYRADIGVQGDRIAFIGRISGRGAEDIDAEGKFVTPGFIEVDSHSRRGLIAQGNVADLVVLDPKIVVPAMPAAERDLPAGGLRLKQKATGIAATVVAGQVILRDGEHTGATPGRVQSGPLAEAR